MKIQYAIALTFILVACGDHKKKGQELVTEESVRPGNCDVDYSELQMQKLKDNQIVLEDRGIDEKAKIVRLNELNSLPTQYLKMMGDAKVPIKMIDGGISNFSELSHLKGKPFDQSRPEYTWDQVGGLTAPQGVFLGTSIGGGNSVSIHESGHVIDQLLDLSSNSDILAETYAHYVLHPANDDSIAAYRLMNKREFFATGFDDFFCGFSSRKRLESQYPRLYDYFTNYFSGEVEKLPVRIIFDSQK